MTAANAKPLKRNWKPEDGEIIRTMVSEGRTYSEIATHFGVTRNSIAGAADRFGARSCAMTSRPNNHIRKPVKQPIRNDNSNRAVVHPSQSVEARDHTAQNIRTVTQQPYGKGTPLLELGPRCCRWATGEDENGRILFCAAETSPSISWCKTHGALVFRKKETR
jgi:hypothetical protein